MPVYLLWVAGIWGVGYVLNSGANMTNQTQRLAQTIVIGGVVYTVYRVAVK